MPLVYVTGISGAGKSSVLREVRRRGYVAYGVDEDGYGRWLDRETGERRTYPVDGDHDPHEWYAGHRWALDVDAIAGLKERVDRDGGLVFLCGVADGDADAWRYFDVVCALVIDDATIRARVGLREDGWFGTRPDELDRIVEWNVGYADRYRGFGAVIVDATRPLSVVVDEVIAAAGDDRPPATAGSSHTRRQGGGRMREAETIHVVTADERTAGPPTPGMDRQQALATGGMWAGYAITEPGMRSGWHHHGEYESAIYVVSGGLRMEFGPDGTETAEAGPGDFVFIPKHAIHREGNPASEPAHIVVVRAGSGESNVNVDGPG